MGRIRNDEDTGETVNREGPGKKVAMREDYMKPRKSRRRRLINPIICGLESQPLTSLT